jgi:hypothetical protein
MVTTIDPFTTTVRDKVVSMIAARQKQNDPWKTLSGRAMGMLDPNNPDPARDWYSRVMSPGYQAYSPENLEQTYQGEASKLKADVFKGWEDTLGGTIANRGTAGSGVANLDWGKLLGKEGGALSNLRGDIWRYGQDATREDTARALGMADRDWQKLMEYMGLLQGERLQDKSNKAANKAGWGQAIGSALGSYFGPLGSIAGGVLGGLF